MSKNLKRVEEMLTNDMSFGHTTAIWFNSSAWRLAITETTRSCWTQVQLCRWQCERERR